MSNNFSDRIYKQDEIIYEVKKLYQESTEVKDKEYMSLENESYHMIHNLYNLMYYYQLSEKDREKWKRENTKETKYLLKLSLAYKKIKINYFYSVIFQNEKKKQNIKISTSLRKHLNYIESEATDKGLQIPSNIAIQTAPKRTIEETLIFLNKIEKELYYEEYKYEKEREPEGSKALLVELCLRTFYPEVLNNNKLPTNYELSTKYSSLFSSLNYGTKERYFSKTHTIMSQNLISDIMEIVFENDIKEIKEIEAGSGILTFWLNKYIKKEEIKNLKITAVDGKENQAEIPGCITPLEKHTEAKKIITPVTDGAPTLYLFNNIKEDITQHMLDILNEIPMKELIGSISKQGLSFCERSNATDYGILYASNNTKVIEGEVLFTPQLQRTELNIYIKENNITKDERSMLEEAANTNLYYIENISMKLTILINIYQNIIETATKIQNNVILSYIYSEQNSVFPEHYKPVVDFISTFKQLIKSQNPRLAKFTIEDYLNRLSKILIDALFLHHKEVEKPKKATVASLVKYKSEIEEDSLLFQGEFEKTKSYLKKMAMTK